LKQASKQWYNKLTTFLYSINFTHSKTDSSLFIRKIENAFITLLIYVDDIVIVGNNMKEIQVVKNSLNGAFAIKDLGHLKFFLGLEIARTKKGIHIFQRKYALEILSDVGMTDAKLVSTPMVKKNEKHFKQVVVHDISAYRRIIGHLLYLVNTKPDISFSVQCLSQFVQAPTKLHHQAAQRVLRYIKFSPSQGIFYPKDTNVQIKEFSDSDWASCISTRYSTTVFSIFLGESLISWKTKK